jgi:hypothetical protein
MAGLVPAIPSRWAQCSPERDRRDKPGHGEATRKMAADTVGKRRMR